MMKPVKWLVLGSAIILWPVSTGAQEPPPLQEQDLAFLEFLGEWETEDGQWMNPLDFWEERPEDLEDPIMDKALPPNSEPDEDADYPEN